MHPITPFPTLDQLFESIDKFMETMKPKLGPSIDEILSTNPELMAAVAILIRESSSATLADWDYARRDSAIKRDPKCAVLKNYPGDLIIVCNQRSKQNWKTAIEAMTRVDQVQLITVDYFSDEKFRGTHAKTYVLLDPELETKWEVFNMIREWAYPKILN